VEEDVVVAAAMKSFVRSERMTTETKDLMMKQEKEMLKIFRSKLFEVEDKMKKTGGKKSNEAVGGIPRSWLERATKLARELEHYKEESIRLDAENERLTKESTRLQVSGIQLVSLTRFNRISSN